MLPKERKIPTMAFLIAGILLVALFPSIWQAWAAPGEQSAAYLPLIFRPENTPTPTPSPTPTLPPPTPTEPPSGWLNYLNYMRALASLAPVSENVDWSDGCWKHSRYMVKNDEISHSEESTNQWYTTEGDEAAHNGNVMVSSSTASSDEFGIDLWMSGPFHGISMLDPQLEVVGFGSYREAIGQWQMGATLDVSRGRTTTEPPAGTYPVMWPGPGQTTSILGYRDTEWPDPLASCPDITASWNDPSGPPIYLQIGSGSLTPNVTATSFKQGNTALEHCFFDETNYTNPDSSYDQNTGRTILDSRDAIIIMPNEPLQAGQTYTVSITANGQVYTWSFNAANNLQTYSTLSEQR